MSDAQNGGGQPKSTGPDAMRPVAHESITEQQISNLVETFYDKVWADGRLGPIFSGRIADKPAHLAKMKDFWSTMLLGTGRFNGRPMPKHVALSEVVDGDFAIWLGLFRPVAHEAFAPEAAQIVIRTAEQIAQTFRHVMFGGMGGRP